MRTSPLRSLVLWSVGCVLLAAWASVSDAAACAKICSTKSLWGTGPKSTNYAPCECTSIVNGLGSGPNDCGCGICYQQVGSRVFGYGKEANGQCPTGGTNCGECDSDSGSGSGSNTTKTTAPPNGKSGTAPTNVNTTTEAPSAETTKSSSNDGLATWQIALIICSCVLVIAVAMTTITSCYCKARNRMKDNMQNEEERHEYEGYWNPNASGGLTERSGHEQLAQSTFNPTMTQAGRSSFTSTHSRPNSTKNMPYSEPTYAVDERIGAGMGGRPAARQSLGSGADLPGVFQPFPQRDARPSHEVGSRKNIAIEL